MGSAAPKNCRMPPAPQLCCLLVFLVHLINSLVGFYSLRSAWMVEDDKNLLIHYAMISYLFCYGFEILLAFGFGSSTLRGFDAARFAVHHIPGWLCVLFGVNFFNQPAEWTRFRATSVSILISVNLEAWLAMLQLLQARGWSFDAVEAVNDQRFVPAALCIANCIASVGYDSTRLLLSCLRNGYCATTPNDPREPWAIFVLVMSGFFLLFFLNVEFNSPGYFQMSIKVLNGSRRKKRQQEALRLKAEAKTN